MNYSINDKGLAIFSPTLHGKTIKISLDYDPVQNTVERNDKFKRRLTHTTLELMAHTKVGEYSDDLNHLIDYLNNVPTIDELHLGYALYEICFFHVLKYRRLIDGDLAYYASILMLIYESWIGTNLDYEKGFNLRSSIIKYILEQFGDEIYITKFVAPSMPLELVKYDRVTNNLGSILRI